MNKLTRITVLVALFLLWGIAGRLDQPDDPAEKGADATSSAVVTDPSRGPVTAPGLHRTRGKHRTPGCWCGPRRPPRRPMRCGRGL